MKKFLSFCLTIALCLSLLPSALAADGNTVCISSAQALRQALDTGGSVCLSADIIWPYGMAALESGELTLDLNGHSISGSSDSYALFLVNGGSLTVTDRTGGGAIRIQPQQSDDFSAPLAVHAGSLTVQGGSYSGLYALRQEGGQLTVTGGHFQGQRHAAYLRSGKALLSGGTFSVDSTDEDGAVLRIVPLSDESVSVHISGGVYTGSSGRYMNAIYQSGGQTEISGGRFESKSFNGVNLTGGTLSISGGSFYGAKLALYAQDRYDPTVALSISGGFFNGTEGGVLFNGPVENLRLSGGYFTSYYAQIMGGVAVRRSGSQRLSQALEPGFRFSPESYRSSQSGSTPYHSSADWVRVLPEQNNAVVSSRRYTPGMFADADESAWYGESGQHILRLAYESGLMGGLAPDRFGIGQEVTLAQVVTMATRLHSQVTGDEFAPDASQSDPWYPPYVEYAYAEGILTPGEFSDFDRSATRAETAYLLAHALPELFYYPINQVQALPDVQENSPYGTEIFLLYRSGVLAGSNQFGTFFPEQPLLRQEAAAILLRCADSSLRLNLPGKLDHPIPAPEEYDWTQLPSEDLQQLDAILALCLQDGMSQRETARAIHDYMVLHYDYDPGVAAGGEASHGQDSYHYTGLLRYGQGVCQAYMELYHLLCLRAGLNCRTVAGYSTVNGGYVPHGWNVLYIDGEELYVDVTFDDPVNGDGSISYRYFLIYREQLLQDHIIGLLVLPGMLSSSMTQTAGKMFR